MLARDNPEKATAQGLLESSISLSLVLGPLIGGFVAHRYGYSGPLYVGAGGAVLALILYRGFNYVALSKTKPPAASMELPPIGMS